jgi:hypothetical protein
MTSKEVFVMGNLVTFQEILSRYEAGENAFDLTLEKWGKIRKSVENAFTLQHFREILDGAVIKVPLCFEYKDNCSICPLHGICSRGQDGSFSKFVRALQAYCIAGDLLPKSPLLRLADQIISELESCKTESSKKMS